MLARVWTADASDAGGTDSAKVRTLLALMAAAILLPAFLLRAERGRRRALDAGFDVHLVKPVDTNRFLEAVATVGRLASSPSRP